MCQAEFPCIVWMSTGIEMAAGLSLLTSEKESETPGEQNLEETQGHWGC